MTGKQKTKSSDPLMIAFLIISACIIACIIWPNFVTTKHTNSPPVSMKIDLPTLQTAIEAYRLEDNKFPINFYCLTTPIHFVQALPRDQYTEQSLLSYYYEYPDSLTGGPSLYLLWSVGPDKEINLTRSLLSERLKEERKRTGKNISNDSIKTLLHDVTYDSSNGTYSSGDVYLVHIDTVPTSTSASR